MLVHKIWFEGIQTPVELELPNDNLRQDFEKWLQKDATTTHGWVFTKGKKTTLINFSKVAQMVVSPKGEDRGGVTAGGESLVAKLPEDV